MDVRGWLATTSVMKRRLALVAAWIAGIAFIVAVAVYTGDWKGVLGNVIAVSAATRLWSLEIARLRRVTGRRAQDLEQHARALGLTPSVSDPRVHEGVGVHGRVSVWLEDPPMLHDDITFVTLWVLFTLGLTKLGILGIVVVVLVVLFGAVLLSGFTSRRPTINVEFVTETGSLHRIEVYRSADVRPALAPMPRLGFAGEGALEFSEADDPAGRIGVARRAGTLSPPESED